MKKSNEFILSENLEWKDVDAGVKRKVMGFDENIMMVKASFEKGAVGRQHKHFHSQVTYVSSGKFDVIIGEESKILFQGDAFYIPPNVMHGATCLESGILIDVFSPIREDFYDNPMAEKHGK